MRSDGRSKPAAERLIGLAVAQRDGAAVDQEVDLIGRKGEPRRHRLQDGGTLLSYTAKANIGGKLAQVGSRLVDGVENLATALHPGLIELDRPAELVQFDFAER